MIAFHVPDMTCGRCAGAIARAIAFVDPRAQVEVSLQDRRVRVLGDAAPAELAEAIADAGYTPAPWQDTAAAPPRPAAGCCCGPRSRAVDDPQAAGGSPARCCA